MRQALQPGAFRDRLTRDIFSPDDPNDRVGLLEYTLKKVIASEEADKKLERAIRKGEVRRYHNNDWIAEAKTKGVLTEEEASSLAELRDLTARVIAVDDFDAAALARRYAPQGAPLAAVPARASRAHCRRVDEHGDDTPQFAGLALHRRLRGHRLGGDGPQG